MIDIHIIRGHCDLALSTFSFFYANVCCDKPGKSNCISLQEALQHNTISMFYELVVFGPPCFFRCRPTSEVVEFDSLIEWRWKPMITMWNYVSISYNSSYKYCQFCWTPCCFQCWSTSEQLSLIPLSWVTLKTYEYDYHSEFRFYQTYNSRYNHFRFSGPLCCFRLWLRASEVVIQQVMSKWSII